LTSFDEKPTPFGLFGCSLDALDAPERVAMKRAFMNARSAGLVSEDIPRDPYDLLAPALGELEGVVVIGKLVIESWLTPRPEPESAGSVTEAAYRDFLDHGGCADVSSRLASFVEDRVLPLRPLLVGVDHSLTGGVLKALARPGEDELALVVLDSHFDAIPPSIRRRAGVAPGSPDAAGERGMDSDTVPPGEAEPIAVESDAHACGDWLLDTLESGSIKPGNVAVIGPADQPGYRVTEGEGEGMKEYRKAYLALEERGVRIVTKRTLGEKGLERSVREGLGGLAAKRVYVSIDADIGSGPDAKAVRFMDTIGLPIAGLQELARGLARWLGETGSRLDGLDIVEIDTHLADIPGSKDRTLDVCFQMAKTLLAAARRG
jgi:arginase family enzyme